jgi:L-cysteate sulfo-lyase
MTDDLVPVRLGSWPTPLEPAPGLARAIGLAPDDLWIKRDDLTGLGGGGNKVRKLEWSIAEALAHGADTLVTTGAAQSNHARLTAAAGARLGLDVHLVLAGNPPAAPTGNLILDALLDARLHWAHELDTARVADDVATTLTDDGRHPYVIPFGGSSRLTARGYATAADEIRTALPDVATVVTAVGSGGTMAGLVSALGTERVLGIATGAVPDPRAAVAALLEDGAELAPSLRIREDQVGDGYASLTTSTRSAIDLAARTEGIILDPTYTGRALAGLLAAVAEGQIEPGRPTVFLHSGGLPGLFGHPDVVGH